MTALNKLTLRGFKSFKNKTTIPFGQRGLTAVVGENGSGKSNLVDALTFVMGQRSSKLRAERLEQLIYNGGKGGQQSNQAEVFLYLDNADGRFDKFCNSHTNGDSPDEISIGRKITRNSSTYKFLDKNCRRSLIDEILEEANVDPSKHHVVNQGKITEIVNMRPSERREIVDDLAGISGYEKRKKEAIVDLREVKEKLMTNRVVLGERRSQLARLKKEREAALEYKNKEEELNRVEQSIVYRKRKNKEAQMENIREKHEKVEQEVSRVEDKLNQLDRTGEQKERNLQDLREEKDQDQDKQLAKVVEQLKMKLVQKRGDINSKKKELDNLQDTIRELKKIKSNRSSSPGKRKNRAVKALLDRGRGGIYGTISDLMRVEDQFRIAIETAVGGHMQDVVVDSRATAIEAVNYLKKNDLGRARLLPLMRLSGGRRSPASKKALNLEGVTGYALDLVDFDPKYRRAFEYVFRDTLVSEDLEAVESADNVRVVTLDGDVLSKGGAITGGTSRKRKSKKSNKDSELSQKISQKEERVERLRREIEQGRERLDAMSQKLEKKEQQVEVKSEENEELKKGIKNVEKELNKIKKEKREVYRRLESARKKSGKLGRELDGLKYELKSLDVPQDENFRFIDKPVKELVNRRRELKRSLDKLEPVNMKSIEEYEQYKQKVDELEDKLSLLRSEKREVERLIAEIEEKKKQQFYSTLEDLSQEFTRIFRRLFDGGNAKLQLEVDGDIESGLLIKVHPPGKELNVLDSLSGGEKSLTAIAFIFALQELNPSPFYVMDEIDAALDKRRSRKLAKLLDKYAKKSQLILISHNEETAKHADCVYGVSMKDSKSKILSIQLN